MKKLSLLLLSTLFTSAGASVASACSAIPMPPLFDFSVYTSGDADALNAQGRSIALFRAKLVEEKTFKAGKAPIDNLSQALLLGSDKTPAGDYQKIEFETLDVLFGVPEPMKTRWYPKLTDETIQRDRDYAQGPRPFAFWDKMSISMSEATDHSVQIGGMCTDITPTSLVPDMTYLVFTNAAGSVVGFEPVSGPDHPLVGHMRDYVAGKPSPAARTPADYFAEMTGYIEFEVVGCPLQAANADDAEHNERRNAVYRDWQDGGEDEFRIQVRDSFNSDPEELSLTQLAAYQKTLKSLRRGRHDFVPVCELEARYLMIERADEDPRTSRGARGLQPMQSMSQRFIKISRNTRNGLGRQLHDDPPAKIQLRDLLTRIKFLNGPSWDVDRAKSAIRKAVCGEGPAREFASACDAKDSKRSRTVPSEDNVCTPIGMVCEGVERHSRYVVPMGTDVATTTKKYQWENPLWVATNVNPGCRMTNVSVAAAVPETVSSADRRAYRAEIDRQIASVARVDKAPLPEPTVALSTLDAAQTKRLSALGHGEDVGIMRVTATLAPHDRVCR